MIRFSRRTIFVGFCICLFAASAGARDLHVATDGSDAWSGSLPAPNAAKSDGPFATIARARDEVRKRPAGEAATVQVRGGEYSLAETLKFGPQDSGTDAAPVVYRAFGDEKPVLVGGKAIRDFTPWKGAILKADVGAQGFRGIRFKQLLCDGQRQPLARYPNFDPRNPYGGGWAYADGREVPAYEDIPGEDKRTLQYQVQDARNWSRPQEVELYILPRHNWWNNIVPLASIDPATRIVKLTADCSYSIRSGDRYFFQNAIEELDAPGEWYLDQTTWTLYFWPPATGAQHVYAPTLATMIEFAPKTANITVRGFTMQCCDGTAVSLKDTVRCLVAGNTIRNVGHMTGSAIAIAGGLENGAVGNDVSGVGNSGISISGGERQTLTPAGNYADNNYVHHFGVYHKQGGGIAVGGVGNRISHNLIHDGPRFAIMHGGNNNVIEFNRIRHVSIETEDSGAIYSGGRDWLTPRGTVIRYNFISDVLGYGRVRNVWTSPYFACGIYLDDNSGGVDVIGNIVMRCSRSGLHAHGARDCRVENNVWIGNTPWQFDFHGWTTTHRFWLSHLPTMIKGFESVANEPAWKGMRGMDVHPKDVPLPDGNVTRGNVFARNIAVSLDPKASTFSINRTNFSANYFDWNLYWNGGEPIRPGWRGDAKKDVTWEQWQALGNDGNSVIADPKFIAPDKDDYRIAAASPALKVGFKLIPVEKIGPYKDPLRASWPIVEAEGARERPLSGK